MTSLASPSVTLAFLSAALFFVSCAEPQAATLIHTSAALGAEASTRQPARVVRVIDGDTIEVELAGRLYKVRYIGVDTPETQHPTRGKEPYGVEAAEKNRQLVEGKTVYLEKDVSETDSYGRLLRYVYIDDDVMVNAVLVREGYARVATYPPDLKYAESFLQIEREAREASRGLWGVSAAVSSGVSADGCDTAYPDVCIPPPPPDLDCGEITYRRFTVLPPDPHRFDGDKDGIGCES